MTSRKWYEWAKQYAKADNDWLDDTDSELYSEMAQLLAQKCSEFSERLAIVGTLLQEKKDHDDILSWIKEFIDEYIPHRILY